MTKLTYDDLVFRELKVEKVWKINGHEVEFYVNEENRIVTATIKHCKFDVLDILRKEYDMNFCGFWDMPKQFAKVELPVTLKSVAKCHPDDTFDPEVGKRVARKKLESKYWDKIRKRMTILSEVFYDVADECLYQANCANSKIENIIIERYDV